METSARDYVTEGVPQARTQNACSASSPVKSRQHVPNNTFLSFHILRFWFFVKFKDRTKLQQAAPYDTGNRWTTSPLPFPKDWITAQTTPPDRCRSGEDPGRPWWHSIV